MLGLQHICLLIIELLAVFYANLFIYDSMWSLPAYAFHYVYIATTPSFV